MAKKNIVSNYDIDMALAMNGVTLKAEDFTAETDTNVKTMIPRRRHTATEKGKADAKWRADFTGKKHHKERTRQDYKEAKLENEWKREYSSYIRGGYDRNGIIQNRRQAEAAEDAMTDIYDVDELEFELNYYCMLQDALSHHKYRAEALMRECDEIAFIQHMFNTALDSAAQKYIYRPTLNIDSYAFDALEDEKLEIARCEAEIDHYRKTGIVPPHNKKVTLEGVNDDYEDEEDEEFEYHRYFDPEIGDHVIKKFRRR